jgi:hypothetical protein
MSDERPSEQSDFVPRIGTFLFLLGVFFFIIFLASDFANQPDFDWLFLGLLFAALGYFIHRRAARPPSSGRFGAIRKFREDAKKRKEKAKKK